MRTKILRILAGLGSCPPQAEIFFNYFLSGFRHNILILCFASGGKEGGEGAGSEHAEINIAILGIFEKKIALGGRGERERGGSPPFRPR